MVRRHSALHDLVTMRLRLGYRYYWEVCRGAEPEPCATCGSPGGHSLQRCMYYTVLLWMNFDPWVIGSLLNLFVGSLLMML